MDTKRSRVAGFMTREAVSVTPETALLAAAHIMAEHNFAGLPVVDGSKKVVGILTEYDLLTKGSAIHLPTFLKLINQFDVYKKDQSLIRDDLRKILSLKVQDVMNDDPLVLFEETPIEDAARTFAEHHKVNPIPIVDQDGLLAGVLSRSDIIKFYADTRPQHPSHAHGTPYVTDQAVSEFLNDFEKNFVAVSRYRTRHWFLISLGFLIVGIIAATIFILRVDISF